MFLKTLDEKQKFIWKIWKEFWKIGWYSDLHGKMNLNVYKVLKPNNRPALHACF